MRHKECWYLLGQPLISGRPPHSKGIVGISLTAKVERGVGIPWYLSYKRHRLASERSVTQQVCDVSFGEKGLPPVRQAAERLVIQLIVRRLTSAEVISGAEGHQLCVRLASRGRLPSTVRQTIVVLHCIYWSALRYPTVRYTIVNRFRISVYFEAHLAL